MIYRDALMPPYATLCHLPVSSPIHTYSTYIHLRYATYTAYAPAGSCLVLFGLMRYACRIVSGFPSSGSFEALLRSWRLRKAEEDRGHLTPETMETTQMLACWDCWVEAATRPFHPRACKSHLKTVTTCDHASSYRLLKLNTA